jgi:hypothetical protein
VEAAQGHAGSQAQKAKIWPKIPKTLDDYDSSIAKTTLDNGGTLFANLENFNIQNK